MAAAPRSAAPARFRQVGVLDMHLDVKVVVAVVFSAAFMVVQLGYFSRPRARFTPALTYPLLAVEAVLAYLPMLEYRIFWTSLPSMVWFRTPPSVPAQEW